MKLYNVPDKSLVKLSEGDGRLFKFMHVDASFGYVKNEYGAVVKLPVTFDVIVVGKYDD